MKLSDNSIAQLVRVLQLAIITGTDVSDNIRMMEFVEEDDFLMIDPDYLETFEANLQKLQDEVPKDVVAN
tara:strand:+ start:899 stop:1108 length:210 start_codon:yes stop_codon:yes gene_type:complete